MYVCFHTQFSFVLYQMYLRLNVQKCRRRTNLTMNATESSTAVQKAKKNKQEGNVFDLI